MKATLTDIRRPVLLRIHVGPNDMRGEVWRLTLDDTNGGGFVSVASDDVNASYHWPARNRGDSEDRRSLLRFLLGADIGYVAGKFGVGNEFDEDATRTAMLDWLNERECEDPDDMADLREIAESVSSQREWEEWTSACSRAGLRDAFECGTCTHVHPRFRAFYEAAWPMLRERRAEIEAVLYPNGLPVKAVA